MIPAYPLQWPADWPRTPVGSGKYGKFGTRSKRPGQSWVSISDITLAEANHRVL